MLSGRMVATKAGSNVKGGWNAVNASVADLFDIDVPLAKDDDDEGHSDSMPASPLKQAYTSGERFIDMMVYMLTLMLPCLCYMSETSSTYIFNICQFSHV